MKVKCVGSGQLLLRQAGDVSTLCSVRTKVMQESQWISDVSYLGMAGTRVITGGVVSLESEACRG